MPSSRNVREMRTAISPRLATRTFVKADMRRVFSFTVSLPDQLTVARVAAVPVVVVLFAWDFPNHAYWATAVFLVAMATDQIDGWLARRRGTSSPLGKLLDPVADKVLVLAALVMLIGEGVAPAWMVALIVVREILVSGLRLAAVERGVVLGARDLGRVKTWAQALAAAIAGFAAAGAWSDDVAWWAILAALVATWVSGLDYALVAPRVLRGNRV
jgi:CDP-diacylglycerol--glycerol-3-phosphate 3-phosphatidyltransferase